MLTADGCVTSSQLHCFDALATNAHALETQLKAQYRESIGYVASAILLVGLALGMATTIILFGVCSRLHSSGGKRGRHRALLHTGDEYHQQQQQQSDSTPLLGRHSRVLGDSARSANATVGTSLSSRTGTWLTSASGPSSSARSRSPPSSPPSTHTSALSGKLHAPPSSYQLSRLYNRHGARNIDSDSDDDGSSSTVTTNEFSSQKRVQAMPLWPALQRPFAVVGSNVPTYTSSSSSSGGGGSGSGSVERMSRRSSDHTHDHDMTTTSSYATPSHGHFY